MQAELQSSFQRVEQALQRLTDSIAAYNPDVRAAEELQAADEAVNEDLKKLVIHQRNYVRKEELRRQTDAYDAEIKSKIRNIADTRKELVNIAAYNEKEGPAREIAVEELLRYAKYITRTTVPPTLPKPEGKKKEDDNKLLQQTNGTATPAPDTQMQEANDVSTGTAEKEGETAGETKYVSEFSAKQREWINTQSQFEAWPMWPTIQSGALGAIQRMVEAGEDPASVLTKEEREGVERARAEEEERERLEDEERRRRWAASGGGGGGGGRGRREVEEEVFNPDDI